MSRIGLVASLGHGRPPNGQVAKTRALLDLLERTGRAVDVVDPGARWADLRRVVPMVRRGQTLVVVLNRKGLWVVLGLVKLARLTTRRRGGVIVPVVGGWLPSYLTAARFRWLAGEVDDFLAETPALVAELRALGLPASELANFRRLPIDRARVRTSIGPTVRLCFAGRIREDKGVVVAARLLERLVADGIPAELDLYGPSEDPAALAAALAVPGVRHRGSYDTAEDALAVLSDYDFLVLPSRYDGECMPGVVVEACFAALPAIVSDWKDLATVVEDGVTGFVCPLEGFEAHAAARVAACLADGCLPALSRGALERAEASYTDAAARDVLMGSIERTETGPPA